MNALRIILLVLLCTHLHAQETSIYRQNFKDVKTVRYYISDADSSGKKLSGRTLHEECSFDTNGRLLERKFFSGTHVESLIKFTYDSLGRETSFSRTEDNGMVLHETSVYSTDSSGRFTLRKGIRNGKVEFTESRYFDSLSSRFSVTYWSGESTLGAGDRQWWYDTLNRLVMKSSYNGFTEFRYDSCGNLTLMLVRQFEDGQCSAYDPHHYFNEYSGCELTRCRTEHATYWFTYNNQGFIATQITRGNHEPNCRLVEAEYEYYQD